MTACLRGWECGVLKNLKVKINARATLRVSERRPDSGGFMVFRCFFWGWGGEAGETRWRRVLSCVRSRRGARAPSSPSSRGHASSGESGTQMGSRGRRGAAPAGQARSSRPPPRLRGPRWGTEGPPLTIGAGGLPAALRHLAELPLFNVRHHGEKTLDGAGGTGARCGGRLQGRGGQSPLPPTPSRGAAPLHRACPAWLRTRARPCTAAGPLCHRPGGKLFLLPS